MLSVAAPLLLSVLGKAVKSGNLNLSSLIGMLTGEKDSYARALPGPLSRLDGYFASPVRAAYAAPPPVEEKKSIWRWLLPLLIALAALWLLSRCMGPKETVTEVIETVPAPVVESAPAPEPRRLHRRRSPPRPRGCRSRTTTSKLTSSRCRWHARVRSRQ